MIKILEKKIQVNQSKCFACGSLVDISYELTNVDGPDAWDKVSFYAPILDCINCSKEIFAPEFHKIENEAMCIASGVLTPDEIKEIRKKIYWGKNNITFSQILGFGSSTIARYESGASMPSKAHNKILTLLRFPEVVSDFEKGKEFQKYFKNNENKLSNENIDYSNVVGIFENINSSPNKKELLKKKEDFLLRPKRA